MTLMTINALKKQVVSDDGSSVTVTIDARHVGELSVLIPASCFDGMMGALAQAKSRLTAREPQSPTQISAKRPNNFLVTADLQTHGLVFLVLDHKTPIQAAYAFDPSSAKKLAESLLRSADALLAGNPAKKN